MSPFLGIGVHSLAIGASAVRSTRIKMVTSLLHDQAGPPYLRASAQIPLSQPGASSLLRLLIAVDSRGS